MSNVLNKIISRYEAFVKQNHTWLLPLEETARSLTIFLPGRFSESELQIYAFLNLSSLSHDRILGRPDRSLVCDVKCSPTTKETATTRRLQNVLTFFHYTEVLIEMAASRVFRTPATAASGTAAGPSVVGPSLVSDSQIGGTVTAAGAAAVSAVASAVTGVSGFIGGGASDTRGKWVVILIVELIKVYCRLRLLRHNRGRMLTTPSQEDTLALQEQQARTAAVDHQLTVTQPELGKYRDLTNLYLEHGRGAHPHGMFSTFTRPPVHPRDTPSFKASSLETAGEVLFFIRPIVYVAARLLLRNGHQSWAPFMLSLLTDVASRMLSATAHAKSPQAVAKDSAGRIMQSSLTPAEQTELSRRLSLLAFYALRSPFFERFTKVPLMRVAQFLNSIPIVGVLFGNVFDLLCALQSHYFYTSAS